MIANASLLCSYKRTSCTSTWMTLTARRQVFSTVENQGAYPTAGLQSIVYIESADYKQEEIRANTATDMLLTWCAMLQLVKSCMLVARLEVVV